MLIILTGPPGAGKSTIAELVAAKLKKSVRFSIDTFRHFIVGGNYTPWDESKQAKEQHKMTDEIVEGVIKKYLQNKYTVILDGIYGDTDFLKMQKKFGKVKAFILLPSLEVTKKRDQGRKKNQRIPQRVKILHRHYSSSDLKHFHKVDSSRQSPKQTAKQILSRI